MARARATEVDDAGQDSFLDIVANTVGILILLVMVVSVRAAYRPTQEEPPAEPPKPAVTNAEVEEAAKQALATRQRVADLYRRALQARREVTEHDAERVQSTTTVAELKREVESLKDELSAEERRDFELAERASQLEAELEKLMREQVALASRPAHTEVIENLPTPLSKRVTGDEVFIYLKQGDAAFVPKEELMQACTRAIDQNTWRFDARDEASVTVGPIDGFRMQFRFRKYTVASPGGGLASRLRLVRYEFLPTPTGLGAPVEQAVKEGSALMQRLSAYSPERATVTVWLYPDSFDEFRALKRALYERGYAVAGRPLPHGVRIGGSPQGTASTTQ